MRESTHEMKRTAVKVADWIQRIDKGEARRVVISCRSYKVYEGQGAWHWGHRFLLNCDVERPFDVDALADALGINSYETPILSYGLPKHYPMLDLEWFGDTVIIGKKEEV